MVRAPVVTLLSFGEHAPWQHRAIVDAATDVGLEVRVVRPTDLRVRIGRPSDVSTADGPLAPGIVLHRTLVRHLDVAVPALRLLDGSRDHVVINPIDASLAARNKLQAGVTLAAAGIPVVGGVGAFAADGDLVATIADGDGAVVSKSVIGHGGSGVERFDDPTTDAVRVEQPRPAGESGDGALLWQRHLPHARDIRAFATREAIVAMAARVPPDGGWRTNIALGGHMAALDASVDVVRLGAMATNAVAVMGLDAATIDLLPSDEVGAFVVSEIDAWGGYRALQSVCSDDIARAVVVEALQRWEADRS